MFRSGPVVVTFGAAWHDWAALGLGAAVAGGSDREAMMNGAIDSGSGSMPSAICIIVTLPVIVIVLLFQSLDLAAFFDSFAASFNAAFLPFIGMALAVAWSPACSPAAPGRCVSE